MTQVNQPSAFTFDQRKIAPNSQTTATAMAAGRGGASLRTSRSGEAWRTRIIVGVPRCAPRVMR